MRPSLFSRFRLKKRPPSLGTITILEDDSLPFLLGPEIAAVLSRRYFDCRNHDLEEGLVARLPWKWKPRVISRTSDYKSKYSDGRVLRINALVRPDENPSMIEKTQVLRRALIVLNGGDL